MRSGWPHVHSKRLCTTFESAGRNEPHRGTPQSPQPAHERLQRHVHGKLLLHVDDGKDHRFSHLRELPHPGRQQEAPKWRAARAASAADLTLQEVQHVRRSFEPLACRGSARDARPSTTSWSWRCLPSRCGRFIGERATGPFLGALAAAAGLSRCLPLWPVSLPDDVWQLRHGSSLTFGVSRAAKRPFMPFRFVPRLMAPRCWSAFLTSAFFHSEQRGNLLTGDP